MKKKSMALFGLATVAGLSLASCGNSGGKVEPIESPYETEAGTVDICLNYNGESGVTLRDATGFANAVDGKNYVQGDLLPTWKSFAALTKTTIREASDYSATKDDDNYKAVKAKGYVSGTNQNEKIDLFYNSTKNIEAMGAANEAVDLLEHVNAGKMPNFKKWLDANPTMAKQITKNGKIFYTPYFDGYQETERMFIMNTQLVTKLLDGTPTYDTTKKNGGTTPDANVLQTGAYTPYINADFNYPADQKLTVTKADGSGTVEITVKKTTNIIKQQNELLNRASGCTGKELADQFVAYLKEAYQNNNKKLYTNLSDIFIGQQAAYNSDDLIALMRVVKANPGVITGDESKEVEGLVPRGVANNRVDNMADFMMAWGVNGLDAEKDALYFGPDGKLHDAYTSQDTYDALKYISAMYDEGLILTNFYYKSKEGGTAYLDRYFGGKKADDKGYALMLYDYSASTGASNDRVDGIGSVNAVSVQGVRPIIPPFAYWATETSWKGDTQALTDFTGKTLTRVSVSNRGLKSTSWCIPTKSDNIESAVRLMDYMFSEEGSRIQDFGPEAYWGKIENVMGKDTPVFSDMTKAMIASAETDFWSFMRRYIGSTNGIGHVRSASVNQQATNVYAQVGYNYLQTAINTKTVTQGLFDMYGTNADGSTKYNYASTVPSAGWKGMTDAQITTYEATNLFWASDKCAETAAGWVKYVTTPLKTVNNDLVCGTYKLGTGDYTFADVLSQNSKKNKTYLYAQANTLGAQYIPDSAK